MNSYFTRSFYKHMNGSPLAIKDIEDIDPSYHQNLTWMLNNDATHLGLSFFLEEDNFGRVEIKELKPNGQNIPVTNENKAEYIRLFCYEKMANSIKDQIKAFLEGLNDIIPKELLAIFDHRELEMMISGLPEIDLEDLKANTEYVNYKKDQKQIRWFWEILFEFT